MFNLVLCRQVLSDDLHTMNPFTERKLIVFESHLVELASVCWSRSKPCHVQQKGECGTRVDFHCHCFCGHQFRWCAQPFSYRLSLGNLATLLALAYRPSTACKPYTWFRPSAMCGRGARNTSSVLSRERMSSWLGIRGTIHQATVPSMALVATR